MFFSRSIFSFKKPSYLLLAVLFFLNALVIQNTYAQTVVTENGRLQVKGNTIVNKNDKPVSFAGNSLFWSIAHNASNFYNAETITHLAKNWKTSIIRASMGVKEQWDSGKGYVESPDFQKQRIKTIVDAAIANGIYVIIDWHSHDAENYQKEAITFFTDMAQTYGSNANIIYEIYNEPIHQTWREVKAYALPVIAAIRAKDPDNLIVVGTPQWSQDVNIAARNPIEDANLAYTLHFYAGSHGQILRNKAQIALDNDKALFVTEWGAVNADGNGTINKGETKKWLKFLKKNHISHVNWAVNDKDETSSIINVGKGKAGLLSNDLTASGEFIKEIILKWSAK